MKILDIKFKNLNSLRGEWHINLSINPYKSDGIFAITGPTGAGKTTIFDAVCLALYGRTPRLARISGQTNEIMSKHTNECYSEVKFECGSKIYQAHWEQEKSGKKFSTAKHTIFLEGDGFLTDRASKTPDKISDIIGLDFGRFTQAVMLEQGGFDKFLKANATDRSKILETLTGTEIYSRISTAVYERCKLEEQKLNDIQIQIDLTQRNYPYPEQTDREILELIEQKESEKSELEAERAKIQEAMQWLKNIAKLRNELNESVQSIILHERQLDNFAPKRKILDSALRANEILAEFIQLSSARKNFEDLKRRIDKTSNEIESDTARLAEIESHLIPEIEAKITRLKHGITENPEAIAAKIEALLKNYIELKKKQIELERLKTRHEAEFKQSQTNLNNSEKICEKARKNYEAALKLLNDLLNRIYTAILDDAKKNLQPGKPCPVCGSCEHSALKHEAAKNHDVDSKITNFDDELRKLREREQEARKILEQSEKNLADLRKKEGISRTNLDNCVSELDEMLEPVKEAHSKLSEALKTIEISGVKNSDEILKRVNEWVKSIKLLSDNLENLNKESAILKSRLETLRNSLNEDISKRENLSAELAILEEAFKSRLYEKNFASEQEFQDSNLPDNELKRLQSRQQELDSKTKELEATKTERERKLNEALSENKTDKTIEELKPIDKELDSKIKSLTNEAAAFKNAQDTRKKIKSELKDLEKKLDSQKKIFSNWSGIDKLIGSKNGAKFSKFAQKITLSMMITQANRQLEKMNGRYILTAKPDNDKDSLDLSVIDKEQGGEVRPTENLSGGERFILSLALALGLSQISAKKASVDSLFLDEGFGSLDENALSMALEALTDIRKAGRTIGVISHVQALKERISAQINVIPKREGTSIIEGPGCESL